MRARPVRSVRFRFANATYKLLRLSFGDYSSATGQDTRLDPELVAACLPIAAQLTTQFRNSGVFGDDLPVGADADEQTRLLAMMGRRG